MNFSFRLENSCMRFKDSFAESLTRLGRSIFDSLILSCFVTTGDLRDKLVTLDCFRLYHTAKHFTKNRALPGKGKLLITASASRGLTAMTYIPKAPAHVCPSHHWHTQIAAVVLT